LTKAADTTEPAPETAEITNIIVKICETEEQYRETVAQTKADIDAGVAREPHFAIVGPAPLCDGFENPAAPHFGAAALRDAISEAMGEGIYGSPALKPAWFNKALTWHPARHGFR
jgi:hypothetical protein